MEKRVAVIGIVVEKEESAETVNAILHEYRDVIAISGKLGMTDGVTSKAIYATK